MFHTYLCRCHIYLHIYTNVSPDNFGQNGVPRRSQTLPDVSDFLPSWPTKSNKIDQNLPKSTAIWNSKINEKSMKIDENLRKSMKINENQCKSLKIKDNQRKSKKNQRKSMKINESQ